MLGNVYQQNTNIIKGFFRKPIVLINAIVIFATIVANLVFGVLAASRIPMGQIINDILMSTDTPYTVNPNSYNVNVNIPIMSVLIAVAFLLFYLFSRNPNRGLNGPATLFQVLSVIQLVIACLVGALCVILIFLFLAMSFSPNGQIMLIFVLLLAAIVALLLTETISRFMFANSIKKSLNGIYLFRNGAKTFAVMQFITVGFSVLSAIGILAFGSTVSPQFYSYYNYTIDSSLWYFSAINVLVGMLSPLFMGILAIQYDSYIKKMTQSFAPPVQPTPFQPVYQEPAPTTSPYDPQHIAEHEPQPHATFCSNCGKQLNPDDYFCNQCGTPVQK